MSNSDKLILGLWDGHESGAALVRGSQIIFAINEERLTRRKLEIGFPARSIQACLQFAGCKPDDIADVAVSTWDPAKTLTRCVPSLAEQYYQIRRKKVDMTAAQRRRKLLKYKITELAPNEIAKGFSNRVVSRHLRAAGFSRFKLRWYDHHHCHATAAAFCSGFDKALVITIDGIGDGLSGSISVFESGKLRRISAISGKTSIGIFFEHVTNLLNMRELEDEGKVMALANFAFPVADSANPLMDFFEVDGLTLRARFGSVRMYRELQRVLWRYPSEQFAAMAQRVLEIKVVQLVRNAIQQTGLHRVAYSGGVASNIKVNMLVHDLPEVERLFVFPHMGDGGLALGVAMAANHEVHGVDRYPLPNLFHGPSFEEGDILAAAKKAGLDCRKSDDVIKETAQLIHGGEIVLWFQGRMELGPRSLGARSILARPDSEEMKNELNLKLKKRVYYQPFCPAMLHDDAIEILENYKGVPNPFMTVGYRVRPEHRSAVRGVINIDGSCRPQILHEEDSRIARLLREYRKLAGRGILLNTSFNTHGEPIVCSPADAVRTFVETDVNHLILEDFIVTKTKEPEFAHVFQPPRNASSRDWLVIVGYVVVALAVIGLGLRWAGRQDLGQFQDKLAYIVAWDLRLVSLLLLGALALAWKNFKYISDAVPCGTKRWLAVICALGLVLTAFVAPRTNRLYYDEHIYQNVAQTIAYEGRALVCNEGTAEHGQYRCEEGQYNKQPAGWSFLVSVAFQLFGVHEWLAHALNNLIFVGAVMAVFWTAVLLFRDHTTGLFAALVYALIPLNLLWSNTASSEPSAAFTVVLSVCATLLFIQQPSHPTCALAFLANVFAAQFRPESILVVAVNGMLVLFLNPRLLREPRFYAWGTLSAVLLLPHAWHLFAVRGQNWGSEGDKFSLAVLQTNLPVNWAFYWTNQRFPVLFTILAWIGLASFAPYRKKLPLLLWFVLFWGVFLFFYAGSYDYGVDSRFSVVSYVPLALLAGLGCGALAGWLSKRSKSACAVTVLPVLIVVCWIPFLPLVRAVTEEAWGARADVKYAKEFAALLPENSIVLTHNPNMFLLMGKNATQLSTVTYNQSHLDNDLFSRFNGGVYLHWNYWCNASDELQKSFAQKIVDQYRCTPVAERRVRDFRYVLYRLENPKANTPEGAN